MSQSPSSSLLRPLVVLVPGIGGSVLADACGRTVYDVNASKGVARVLDPTALAVDKELRAMKPIRSYGIAFKQLVTGYENLWAALVQGLGLSQAETAVAGERLVRPNASLLAFPYDFRQSVAHTAELLDRELRRRAQGRPVVLVAHSMGGLVAAWWWAFLSDGIEVKEIVTLGTPYRGAAKALDVLVNQLSFSGLRLSGITEVIRGWDSVFDLLPHCQVVEKGTGHCYPYELPPSVTSVVPDFAARARKAYAANRELHKRLEERASREGNPLTLYYSQGHATLSRTVLQSGVLTVSKEPPSWLPREWDAGDGTVPMFSAIPHFLEDSARAWHRLPQKHLGLVEADTVANHLGGYGLRPLSAAARGGGDEGRGAYLCVDLDDTVAAKEEQAVAVRVLDANGSPVIAKDVGLLAAGHRVRGERDGESWKVTLPPLDPGVHKVTIQAVGLPRGSRAVFHGRVGAVSCENQ